MSKTPGTKQIIFSRIKPILHQISPDIQEDEIIMGSSLINDLAIDSLKVAELSILLEDAFGLPFFIPDLISKKENPYEISVKDLVQYIGKGVGDSL